MTATESTDGSSSSKKKRKLREEYYKTVSEQQSWRKQKEAKRLLREAKLLEELEKEKSKLCTGTHAVGDGSQVADEPTLLGHQSRYYTLAIALPGSILNNAQSQELRTYLAGQIARAAVIFCVDEIVVFDETSRMKPEQIESYTNGKWSGNVPVRDDNIECCFHLARILEFLECPQYLRKSLFPLQKTLKFAGILNPLDCMHHLRATDLSIPYREGIVLDKPTKKNRGPYCDVGLDKELQLPSEIKLPPGTRITVKLTKVDSKASHYRGEPVSSQRIRREVGIYWGYTVRLAAGLTDAMAQGRYDVIVGTSERGKPIKDLTLPLSDSNRVLVVFGGLEGLEAAVDADEKLNVSDPSQLFEYYVNSVPDQGSRTIRTEEAIPITLSALKMKLDSVEI
ncbi:hypothetical protein AB6A40_003631 [Gnathostoma spinigerum]|uniref:Uncharacterized protein n=1 Tax=Gnathostoma spinigerum TaxID=75299 RepID=A0ABD6EJQ6_9BILA